jgi:hypothetical protein
MKTRVGGKAAMVLEACIKYSAPFMYTETKKLEFAGE